jgi:large subunit ribosomal protein L16
MLQRPKKSKYKKNQKGKSFNKVNTLSTFKNYYYNTLKVVSLSSGRISAYEIKSIKAIIRKGTRKKSIVKSNVFPYNPITKKPNEIRMGKGKGNISHFVFNSKKGDILFEIKTKTRKKLQNVLNKVKKRLCIKIKVI